VVRIWDAAAGARKAEMKGHRATITHLAWAPDGRRVASGSTDQTVRVWSADGTPIRTLEAGERVFAVEFTRAGDRMVVAADDSQVIWDAHSWTRIAMRRAEDPGYTLDITGQRALSCTLSSPMVWQIDTGKVLAELIGHTGDVTSCRFSRDGNLAATGSTDGTARIWDPATGDLLGVIRGTGVEVRTVAFSHDGSQLLIGSESGAALWQLPTFTGDFDRIVRCRVPFAVAGDRLVPRPRDPAACTSR